jgi:branched-chain amino acid transport system substrate-binding protein
LQPDLIYFGGTSQSKAGQVAKDIRSVGMKAKLMVPDGCKEEAFIKAAGEESLNETCYVTFAGLPYEKLDGIGREFYNNYKKKYKGKDHKTGKVVDLEPEPYAVYGYEACKVALAAIKKAGKKDREAIIDAALNITNFEGAFGKYGETVFDANGDTTVRNVSGDIVRDGKFTFQQNLRELGTKKDK